MSSLSLSSTRHDPRTHIHSAYTYMFYTHECRRAHMRVHTQKACPLSQKPGAHRIYSQPNTHTHPVSSVRVAADAECARALSSASDNTSVRIAYMRCRYPGPVTRPSLDGCGKATQKYRTYKHHADTHTVVPDLQKHTHTYIFSAHIRMLLLFQLHIASNVWSTCVCM